MQRLYLLLRLTQRIDAISAFSYSLPKVFPVGFPQLPEYWTIEMSDTSTATASGTTAGTAYNPAGLSQLAPIGAWHLQAQHVVWIEFVGSARYSVQGGISTDRTSISDINLRFYSLAYSTTIIANGGYMLSKNIHITNPTTYYSMALTSTAGATAVKINGGDSPTIIRLVSLYL